MDQGLGRQRLVALFAAGWLLLNFPLLALWDRDAAVWGLPLFPAALFLLWGSLIVLLGWLMESMDDGHGAAAPQGERPPLGGSAAGPD